MSVCKFYFKFDCDCNYTGSGEINNSNMTIGSVTSKGECLVRLN